MSARSSRQDRGLAATAERPKLRLGISACLLGTSVRYDGGHKRDAFLSERLAEYVEWVPVCPEVEAGLGVPRPAMRLERARRAEGVRLRETVSGTDHTERMQTYAARRVRALRELDLCGYVLKKGSPSCGVFRVKLFGASGPPSHAGQGLFASALLEALPNLPVEEEGRLQDPRLRENFLERIFAYQRLRELFAGRWTRGQVIAFHTGQKLQLMAHSPEAYRRLGRRVAALARVPRAEFRDRYQSEFMAALTELTTRGRNANALQHAAGFVSEQLDPISRTELSALIHDYRRGRVPLVAPVTLLRHHVLLHGISALAGQTFLEPHPKELLG